MRNGGINLGGYVVEAFDNVDECYCNFRGIYDGFDQGEDL